MIYRYKLTTRFYPKFAIKIVNNIIYYDRKLTDEEIKIYKLEEI